MVNPDFFKPGSVVLSLRVYCHVTGNVHAKNKNRFTDTFSSTDLQSLKKYIKKNQFFIWFNIRKKID